MKSKVAILTSKDSWFLAYAKKMVNILAKKKVSARLFTSPKQISDSYEIVFVLSYFKVLSKSFIKKHKHVLVVHESALPQGKGWSPLFWQILEGKNKVPIVLFEATDALDSGDVYLKDYILLKGYELHGEVRQIQAETTIKLCMKFLRKRKRLKALKQKGKSTYYKRRDSESSQMSPNSTLAKQFNLLRIVNNDDFPAFFVHKGHKYILKIYRKD
ncbi:MAG: methionyl-tRNA formyltransferase [Candidatus Omnitrophica bacterium]|nr:methionyl-tRNA formyltransferase [Candidatus Omnitrophota bacterium]